jgi:hypothetical protein
MAVTKTIAKLQTIHDLQEFNGFNAQILADNRMTDELRHAIAVRRAELERLALRARK